MVLQPPEMFVHTIAGSISPLVYEKHVHSYFVPLPLPLPPFSIVNRNGSDTHIRSHETIFPRSSIAVTTRDNLSPILNPGVHADATMTLGPAFSSPGARSTRLFCGALSPTARGLHSFTFQLNVSAFHGIGGAFRG